MLDESSFWTDIGRTRLSHSQPVSEVIFDLLCLCSCCLCLNCHSFIVSLATPVDCQQPLLIIYEIFGGICLSFKVFSNGTFLPVKYEALFLKFIVLTIRIFKSLKVKRRGMNQNCYSKNTQIWPKQTTYKCIRDTRRHCYLGIASSNVQKKFWNLKQKFFFVKVVREQLSTSDSDHRFFAFISDQKCQTNPENCCYVMNPCFFTIARFDREQGDPMRSWKNRPKCNPNPFYIKTNT
jgi:hypothetical protein